MKHAIAASNAEQRDVMRAMDKRAQQIVRDSVRDSRLANQVEQLDGLPVQTISQDIYKVALLKLTEIATTDEAERVYENKDTGEVKVVTVANPRQLQALEILLEHRIAEGALLLKAQELDAGKQAERQPTNVIVLSQEQLKRMEELQRGHG